MLGVFGGSTEDPVKSPASSVAPQDPVGDLVPAVSDPVGVVQGGEVVFTWTNPDPKEGMPTSGTRTPSTATVRRSAS
jgi:hypothetical protein